MLVADVSLEEDAIIAFPSLNLLFISIAAAAATTTTTGQLRFAATAYALHKAPVRPSPILPVRFELA